MKYKNTSRKKLKIVRVSTVPASLYTFCNGVLKALSEKYEVVAVSSPGDRLNALGEREGVEVRAVAMERHISPFKDLKSLWRLWRLFKKERPDMVHSMTPKAGLLSMMAARMAGVPVRVHTFTGLIWPTTKGFKRRILIITDKILCSCATHLNPEGRGVRDDMVRQGITRKDLTIIANGNVRGIDKRYYDPERADVIKVAEPLKRHDKVTFIFVGRLVGDKGINELVEAFGRLHKMRPETRLVLVGQQEPDLDPLSTDTLDKMSNDDGIEVVGRQEDVRPWLLSADVLAFPSYREGFPNVVLEAGAMGLPAIVTDINGSREIIENEYNGMIIKPRDSEALLGAMLELTDNGKKRVLMASRAREHIISKWSTEIVRQGLYDYYDKILAERLSLK